MSISIHFQKINENFRKMIIFRKIVTFRTILTKPCATNNLNLVFQTNRPSQVTTTQKAHRPDKRSIRCEGIFLIRAAASKIEGGCWPPPRDSTVEIFCSISAMHWRIDRLRDIDRSDEPADRVDCLRPGSANAVGAASVLAPVGLSASRSIRD